MELQSLTEQPEAALVAQSYPEQAQKLLCCVERHHCWLLLHALFVCPKLHALSVETEMLWMPENQYDC